MIDELFFDATAAAMKLIEKNDKINTQVFQNSEIFGRGRCRNKCRDPCPIIIYPTDFTNVGYVISQPNRTYILAGDVMFTPTAPDTPAISIRAGNVRFDLGNYTIAGNGIAEMGILIASKGVKLPNILIENGTIKNFSNVGIVSFNTIDLGVNNISIENIIDTVGVAVGIVINGNVTDRGRTRIKNCRVINISGNSSATGFGSFRYPFKITNCVFSDIRSATGGAAGIQASNQDINNSFNYDIIKTKINKISGIIGKGLTLKSFGGAIFDLKVIDCEISQINSTNETNIVAGIDGLNLQNYTLRNNVVSNLVSSSGDPTKHIGYLIAGSSGVIENCREF